MSLFDIHPNTYLGIPVISNTRMVEQFRFPKSKKRRIRKKWAKRPENWRPIQGVLFIDIFVPTPLFLCHPTIARVIPQGLTQ